MLEQVLQETINNINELPSPEEFSMEVERRTWEDKDEDSYIFHTAKYIDELDIEPEEGKRLIIPALMDKIRAEATKCKMLKERITTSHIADFA